MEQCGLLLPAAGAIGLNSASPQHLSAKHHTGVPNSNLQASWFLVPGTTWPGSPLPKPVPPAARLLAVANALLNLASAEVAADARQAAAGDAGDHCSICSQACSSVSAWPRFPGKVSTGSSGAVSCSAPVRSIDSPGSS